ncbi:uncharacterized protein N7479_007874 [Penicillium vulpinum]|uniref:Apple domain-containing protein n=1 Tax=Penicillium vulpinum TaxID=29845 RepID=A0A1V6R2Q4_9EURO|nr:uncharacterized protein N7479_007874 [Penicillium vulpinum]KAJ5960724.1 hypothetical protein N7479_007874 [Penicillium vulpinum]OQD95760.1 hypothetical protein PENVUL_c106G04654 [Penicillium vulpinum]
MVSASYSALLALLSARTAWATTTQAPSGGNCLSLSGGSPREVYKACCGQTKSDKGFVDGVEFSYTCETWAMPYNHTPVKVNSARECAKRCSDAGADCPASSWQAGGNCYFITSDSYSTNKMQSMLLLEKTSKLISEPESEPAGGCGAAADAAGMQCEKDAAVKCQSEKETDKAQCEQEKTALADNTKKQAEARFQNDKGQLEKKINDAQAGCKLEKDAASSKCATEKDQLRKQTDDARSECQAEKDNAVSNANSQCTTEKDKLRHQGEAQCKSEKDAASSQCANEKDQLRQQGEAQCKSEKDAASSQCANEKDRLQKQTDDAWSQCQAEKDNAVSNANSQCTSEKDKLRLQAEGNLQQSKSQLEANKVLDTKNICPQYHLREFFLPTPDGGTSKWRVYCDHAAFEIRWNAAGFMNETGTPYNQLLAHRHWDAGYRAFYWRDTDFFHRHLTIYTVEPNLRQSQLNTFYIQSLPRGRHHVIVRIDDVPFKII